MMRCNYCAFQRIKEDNPGKEVKLVQTKDGNWYKVKVNGVMVMSFMKWKDHCFCRSAGVKRI
jgi:hypothetical protein